MKMLLFGDVCPTAVTSPAFERMDMDALFGKVPELFKNKDFALSMLKKELEETKPDSDARLFEPIGGGYVRLDLHKAKADKIQEEKIAVIFMESANSEEKGEIEPKFELLKKLAKKGKTPFSENSLLEYLSGYNGEMVSHSEIYRKAYAPAYRVVLEKLAGNLQ